ncbi:MAG: MBL fold metallo-hydrolase [Anaerolineales bacterium]
METPLIHTLDLNFMGRTHAIAAYALPHSDGVALVECGPGSTLPALEAGLGALGYRLSDVTHVLLTHIHLDHAGAAGALARAGATIYVHPVGAPHLLNPEKLLASAGRIYGEMMDTLWGAFLPVPPEKLVIAQHEQEIAIGRLRFIPLNTPGHAEHHFAYIHEDVCFSGDVGGVRMPGYRYLRAPMPPPELHLPRWRESVRTLRGAGFRRIAPTHFGIFEDADWQLDALDAALAETERWLEQVMPTEPDIESLRAGFADWMDSQARAAGLLEEDLTAFALANPIGMSADGLMRYWKKVRMAQ